MANDPHVLMGWSNPARRSRARAARLGIRPQERTARRVRRRSPERVRLLLAQPRPIARRTEPRSGATVVQRPSSTAHDVRVLQPVAGQDADDRLGPTARRPRFGQPPHAGHARRRGRLAEDRPPARAMRRCASRISSSLTASMRRPTRPGPRSRPCHDAGLPMRMAVATVSGCSTGAPLTIGAAPAAWKPSMRGRLAARPVVGVPAEAPPVGGDVAGVADRQRQRVGRPPELVTISKAAVCCPAMRSGLTLVDDDRAPSSPSAPDGVERLVEVAVDADQPRPAASACASLPRATLPAGSTTKQASPAAAA